MLTQWVRSWVSSGTHPTTMQHGSIGNLSSIYATNLICLAVGFFLVIQLPFYLSTPLQIHHTKVDMIIVHVLALYFVPSINRRHHYLGASLLFYCIYGSYIFLSSRLTDFQADTHLFFLLGLFVIPFIFPSDRNSLRLALSVTYLLAFLFIEWHSSPATTRLNMQFGLELANRCIFAMTCFVAAFQVHMITASSWKKENREKTNSESLLSNMLPKHITKTLKISRKSIAQYHSNVTILFADIGGFTTLASQLDPMKLVDLLDELFSVFDEICARHNLEKIKTLGDGYMVVGGLDQTIRHTHAACLCAKEMRNAYRRFCNKHRIQHGIRIGLNTGPVVAGVIGQSKYTFDVWGDAVNLAARMQSHGETDKIQVSEATFDLAKAAFDFSSRHQLFIKGMGDKHAYWLL